MIRCERCLIRKHGVTQSPPEATRRIRVQVSSERISVDRGHELTRPVSRALDTKLLCEPCEETVWAAMLDAVTVALHAREGKA